MIDVLLDNGLHASAEEVAPSPPPPPPPHELRTSSVAIFIGLLLILPVLPL
jgi:hypothetical protein